MRNSGRHGVVTPWQGGPESMNVGEARSAGSRLAAPARSDRMTDRGDPGAPLHGHKR